MMTTFLTNYSFVVNNYLCNFYFVTYISFKRLFIYLLCLKKLILKFDLKLVVVDLCPIVGYGVNEIVLLQIL